MAEKKKRKSSRRPRQRSLTDLFRRHKRQKANEFKPDAPTATLFKTRKLTQQQQLRLTKWVLYVVIIVLCLVIQDTVMCRLPLLGATTDLPVAAILLITVTEGTDVGSLFILIASVLYYFRHRSRPLLHRPDVRLRHLRHYGAADVLAPEPGQPDHQRHAGSCVL